MLTQKYTLHILAASVLFTLGNAIILMPSFNLLELGLSFVLSLAVICVASLLIKLGQKNKFMFCCVSVTVIVAAIYGAVITFLDYIFFLKAEQTSQIGIVWTSIVLAVVCIYFATRQLSAIYKYCLFAVALVVLIMLVCIFGGIKVFDYDNFGQSKWNSLSFVKNYLSFFLPVIVLPFGVKSYNQSLKPLAFGVMGGFLLLGIATLQTVLTLGENFNVSYPYLKAVSVISSGSLFTRLDGLVWFLFFVSSVVKTTICIKTVFEILKQAKR